MKRNNKKLIMLASVLVLIVATIGGSIAYMAAKTTDVVNEFTFGNVPIDIPEKFDGTTKSDVKVHNNGSADAFVRAKIVVTWKSASGEVSATAVKPGDYTLKLNKTDWFQGTDGFWYCTNRVKAGKDSAVLINTATKAGTAPEGYDLSIEILAQSVQADGMKDGKPVVEAIGWPVTASPAGQHPQTIAAK